jgi:hypothetical protein
MSSPIYDLPTPPNPPSYSGTTKLEVEVVYSEKSLNIPLRAMAIFMIKLALASIPAIVVFYLVWLILSVFIWGIFGSLYAAFWKLTGS